MEIRSLNLPPKQDSISFTYFLHKLGLTKHENFTAKSFYNKKL